MVRRFIVHIFGVRILGVGAKSGEIWILGLKIVKSLNFFAVQVVI